MGAKWLLLLCGSATALRAAGAARCLAPRTTSFSMMTAAGERTFCRAKDLLSTGERATAREVVNVLGRWQSHAQWNEIGAAKQLDRVDPTDGFLAYRRSRVRADPDRTPMRRAACRKLGQAQRFLLKENVGSLPFKSANLAASVGATPAELNREPISDLACDIVFDALCTSQSSIVEKRLADANRARYEASDGKFAADAFASDLAAGRRTIAISMAIFPGSLNALFLYLFFRLDALSALFDYQELTMGALRQGWAEDGLAVLPLPLAVAALLAFAPSSKIGKPLGGGKPPN